MARAAFGEELGEAVALLHRVDEVFSTYRRDSDVSRLGRGELALDRCAPEVREVSALCQDAEARSGGRFTAGYAGVWDPTGLVKGWAVERAARLLWERGATSVCLNGGGDVQVFGGPWRVGITHPSGPAVWPPWSSPTELSGWPRRVRQSGAATSSTRTPGVPPVAGLASLTVLSPNLTDADAWATAAYAMGDQAREWLEELPRVEALAITIAGGTWRTSGFDAHASHLS